MTKLQKINKQPNGRSGIMSLIDLPFSLSLENENEAEIDLKGELTSEKDGATVTEAPSPKNEIK